MSTVRFESGYELPPDEVEKMDGASRGRSLVPSLLRPSDDAVSDSCSPTTVDAGRFLTSLRFLPAVASAPLPSYCLADPSRRRANADAVEANETWLAFQRVLSPPRIDSTGETGRVLGEM